MSGQIRLIRSCRQNGSEGRVLAAREWMLGRTLALTLALTLGLRSMSSGHGPIRDS